jgi:hypothetical protein
MAHMPYDGDYVQAEVVKAFISSDEYRRRFAQYRGEG